MPFYGPIPLGTPLGAGDPRIEQFARALMERVPGLAGLTTYPGPQGGGASGFGFTAARNPFEGLAPSTVEALIAGLPVTAPGAAQVAAAPESMTQAILAGGPERLVGGGAEAVPSAMMGVPGEVTEGLAGRSQEAGLMGALQGAVGLGVSSSLTASEAAPLGRAGQIGLGLLGLAPGPIGVGATALGLGNLGIGLGRATAANLAADRAPRPASEALLAQRRGEFAAGGLAVPEGMTMGLSQALADPMADPLGTMGALASLTAPVTMAGVVPGLAPAGGGGIPGAPPGMTESVAAAIQAANVPGGIAGAMGQTAQGEAVGPGVGTATGGHPASIAEGAAAAGGGGGGGGK